MKVIMTTTVVVSRALATLLAADDEPAKRLNEATAVSSEISERAH